MRVAPDAIGYQKCDPVSGSEYDSVPMRRSGTTFFRYVSTWYSLATSRRASTALMCIT